MDVFDFVNSRLFVSAVPAHSAPSGAVISALSAFDCMPGSAGVSPAFSRDALPRSTGLGPRPAPYSNGELLRLLIKDGYNLDINVLWLLFA
jgi:hypothetical protein